MQFRNWLSLSDGNRPKNRGNYTGERLKSLRPETYREVVRLLAEPREHVSIREICRQCHVTDDTVKAVKQREAVPIATRKQELLMQAARIAKRAADRVEDQIDNAPLPQAVVAFGVMTDKISLLSNDAQQLSVTHTFEPGPNLYQRLNELHRKLSYDEPKTIQASIIEAVTGQPALPSNEPVSGSGAENGL
jgi:hypothetical protein